MMEPATKAFKTIGMWQQALINFMGKSEVFTHMLVEEREMTTRILLAFSRLVL